jgi:serine/threonine protein kinase
VKYFSQRIQSNITESCPQGPSKELLKEEKRLRRFRQEARAVLTINHPNILTIYEIGDSHDINYIATEYIEGETLRHRLCSEPLSLDEALGIGIQVAMALEAAHEEGIVHRDIKPENIMLREDRFVRDRFVKVLDFGLAKLTERETTPADPEAVTIPVTQTNPGAVIGTGHPEQVVILIRAQYLQPGCGPAEVVTVQGRTDVTRVSIWITNHHRCFNISRTTTLERIVSKAQQRGKRYQTVTDLKLDLEQLRDELIRPCRDCTSETSATLAETITIALPTHHRAQLETLASTIHRVSNKKLASIRTL